MGTRAASISLFAVKYLRYMFHVVCKLAPFASVSHWAISCIHVMPVSGGVGVEGWEAPTALSGAEDVDDDDNCAEVRGMG